MKMLNILFAVCVSALGLSASLAAQADDGWRQQRAVSADGTAIAYYIKGAGGGVPLLVISGGPGSNHRYMRVGGSFEH